MARIDRSQARKLAGVGALLVFVLVGLPALAKRGLLTGSTVLLVVGAVSACWGAFVALAPEKHDLVIASGHPIPGTERALRLLGERVSGVVAIVVGIAFAYVAVS